MWDFIKVTEHRAAKPHVCAACSADIAVGDLCIRHAGVIEGSFDSYRLCLRCNDLAHAWTWKFPETEGFPMDLHKAVYEAGFAPDQLMADHRLAMLRDRIAADQAERRHVAISAILAGRLHQVDDEGHAPIDDVRGAGGFQLSRAAAYYLLITAAEARPQPTRLVPSSRSSLFQLGNAAWPWSAVDKNPKDAWSNLVRAGALILAEMERLQWPAAETPPTMPPAADAAAVICARCGATVETYADVCAASLNEACEGFRTIEVGLAAGHREFRR